MTREQVPGSLSEGPTARWGQPYRVPHLYLPFRNLADSRNHLSEDEILLKPSVQGFDTAPRRYDRVAGSASSPSSERAVVVTNERRCQR
jgi:hypothetical protein